jgi:hypothetical protein
MIIRTRSGTYFKRQAAALSLGVARNSATFKAVALRATTPHPVGSADHLPPQGGKGRWRAQLMIDEAAARDDFTSDAAQTWRFASGGFG